MAEMLVRRLGPEEGAAYRAVRLRALEDAPDAFSATLQEALARPLEEWDARLAQAAVSGIDCPLGAERDGELVGQAWAKVDADDPDTVNLYQMWVAPKCRGQGVAGALLAAAIDWARARGARTVGLGVNCANPPAIALYERVGFRILGEAYPMAGAPGRMEYAMRLQLGA
ncbi:GNAT family N-acetyltransferase [Massilia sp. 9I]|uniref:GNAT family N-acetyltransferase n=1 Tax=Massilia sp. 9I TaxID=2653152 RepID=UPI0012F405B3|nr:GNAT family N-acetyltransferase [Massilia sp. 9I]VXB49153.1 Ribosomal protein S18 acetylase RimI [Massilia sp. 9I]